MNKSVSIHCRMSRWGYFKNGAQEIKFWERQFTELVWSALSASEKKLPQVIIVLVNQLRNAKHHCFSENLIIPGNTSMPCTEHTSRTLFLNARLSSVSDFLLWLSTDSSVGWKWNDSGNSLTGALLANISRGLPSGVNRTELLPLWSRISTHLVTDCIYLTVTSGGQLLASFL
jgi:hypothetical protein